MKFELDGAKYEIEFKREYRQIPSGYDEKNHQPLTKPSRFPYTTVNIWKQEPAKLPELYRTATVGAHHTEAYTHEKGRIYALRLVGKTLTKAFRAELWKAYMQRTK